MQAAYWVTLAMCLALGLCAPPAAPGAQQQCQTPPNYTGGFSVATQNGKLLADGKYSYDAVNQRILLAEMGTYNNNYFTFSVLMNFQEGILYEFNEQDKSCVKKPLQSDFHPLEVPKEAIFMSQVVLGTSSSSGQGLLVNNWGDMRMYEGQPESGSYILTVTDHDCLPVSALVKTKDMGWIVVGFFNNILGADRDVFTPPPFCKDAKLETPEDGKKVDFFSVFH